ncbi:MAG: hypothetical protein ACR5LF_12105 [Symbiopectobacterium sp.]
MVSSDTGSPLINRTRRSLVTRPPFKAGTLLATSSGNSVVVRSSQRLPAIPQACNTSLVNPGSSSSI